MGKKSLRMENFYSGNGASTVLCFLDKPMRSEMGAQKLTSRERVLPALQHQAPDRVPFNMLSIKQKWRPQTASGAGRTLAWS
jgi:hypothetical protein